MKAGLDSPSVCLLGAATKLTPLTSSKRGPVEGDAHFSQDGQQKEMSQGLWTELRCAAPPPIEDQAMLPSGLRLDLRPAPNSVLLLTGGAIRARPSHCVILSI